MPESVLHERLRHRTVLAVSGHRDLREGDLDALRISVKSVLEALRAEKEIVLLTALAEGADQLVAEVAQELGIPHYAVLPGAAALYRANFDESLVPADPKARFDALLASATDHAELPIEETDADYEQLGDFLLSNADALLALWDGVDAASPGGTSDVVRTALEPAESPQRLKVLYHLITPRQRNPFPLGRYFHHHSERVVQTALPFDWYRVKICPRTRRPAGVAWWKRAGFQKFVIPALLALLTVILGMIGYADYQRDCLSPTVQELSLENLFFKTLSLLTIGSLVFEDCPGRVPLLLTFARWLGFIFTLYAVVQVVSALFDQASKQWRIFWWTRRSSRPYALLIGLNNRGYELLRDLRQQGEKVKVTVIDPEGQSPHAQAATYLGAHVFSGDPTDEGLLRRVYAQRAQRVFALHDNDALNLRAIQQLEQMAGLESKQTWFVNVDNARERHFLSRSVQHRRANQRSLFVFNLHELIARRLLLEYPIDRFYQTPQALSTDVFIVGFGELGQQLALHCLRVGHFDGKRHLNLHVLASNRAEAERAFRSHYPAVDAKWAAPAHTRAIRDEVLPPGRVVFHELPVSDAALLSPVNPLLAWLEKAADTPRIVSIYFCLDDGAQSASTLTTLLPRLEQYRSQPQHSSHEIALNVQVFCHYNFPDEAEASLLERRLNAIASANVTEAAQKTHLPVTFFGNFIHECSAKALTERNEDTLPRLLALWYYLLYDYGSANYGKVNEGFAEHLGPRRTDYEKDVKGLVRLGWLKETWPRCPKEELAEWSKLVWEKTSESDRDSNRQAADHLWVKLRLAGYRLKNNPDFVAQPAWIEPETLDNLARLEHTRWCAERLLNGWTALADVPGLDHVRDWKSAKQHWKDQKLHADLHPFDTLTEDEQQKDHAQIEAIPYLLWVMGLQVVPPVGGSKIKST